MERRELYDPEDIEQLLFERPYDTLLDEERAFVLRHLSGRAEYEAMRALLLRVHQEDVPPPGDAAPHVREQVLAAFRAEQRPQWRIWLNSIGGALWPRDLSHWWRPALAFGSVAALIGVGLVMYRSAAEQASPALAEVRKEEPTAPMPRTTTQATPSDLPAERFTQGAADSGGATDDLVRYEEEGIAPLAPVGEVSVPAQEPMSTVEADAPAAVAAAPEEDRSGEFAPMTAESAKPVQSQVMTDADLARNMSTANGSVTLQQESLAATTKKEAREKARKAVDRQDRTPADDEQDEADVTALVGLLRAAW